jgi:hypothetical protein
VACDLRPHHCPEQGCARVSGTASGSDSCTPCALWGGHERTLCVMDLPPRLRTPPLERSNAHAFPSVRSLLALNRRGSKPEAVKALEAAELAAIEAGEGKPSVGGMKPGWEPKRTIAIVHDNSR